MTTRSALKASDDEQATVLVSLGVDDHDGHLVQLDYRGGHCANGSGVYRVVVEAIAALPR